MHRLWRHMDKDWRPTQKSECCSWWELGQITLPLQPQFLHLESRTLKTSRHRAIVKVKCREKCPWLIKQLLAPSLLFYSYSYSFFHFRSHCPLSHPQFSPNSSHTGFLDISMTCSAHFNFSLELASLHVGLCSDDTPERGLLAPHRPLPLWLVLHCTEHTWCCLTF